MSDQSNVNKAQDELLGRYSGSRTTRALVQLIPMGIGSAADVWVKETLQRIQKQRAQIFFDKLDQGEILLSEDVIKSDDFLHCFFITSKAALNTRRKEKIELFAALLKSTFVTQAFVEFDKYEELLGMLDEVSWREWTALTVLASFSDTPRGDSENDLQWSWKFWSAFKTRLESELNLEPNEVVPFLNRISRTGLYNEITGGLMDYSGGVGVLTPQYYQLASLVRDETAQ